MKNKNLLVGCMILPFIIGACSSLPKSILPIPEKKQVEWQKMETYAFVHFGLNTFNDKEWGYGDIDPKTFNPSNLDCEQWVQTFVKAGLKGVILTAKHHDGFCLWPTQYTDYSVKSSPWKNGKGDVVGDLAAACKKYGIKFAVYISPWDRHQSFYGTPEYVDYFHKQLTELMSKYGDVFEVWFDGANGGDGWYGGANDKRSIDRKTYYNYPKIYQILDKLQPQAVVFSDGGPGCRWVGNESGYAGETNWAFLRKGEVYPGYDKYRELQFGHADGNQWTAAECDVSIRPGWFYHTNEDKQVKSVEHLTDLYYKSVGRNATLLLNFPVDKTGRVNPIDSIHAVQWHQRIQMELGNNILAGIIPESSNSRNKKCSPAKVTDNSYDTYWSTADGITSASLTFKLRKEQLINRILIQEYIPLGQRVKSFNIEALIHGEWQPASIKEETTTVGYKRILRFSAIKTNEIRINFTDSRGPILINNIEAYYAPSQSETQKHENVEIPSGINYTLTGVNSDEASKASDRNVQTTCFITSKQITFDLAIVQKVSSLHYLPDQGEYASGLISSYELYASDTPDRPKQLLVQGEFSNIKNNPIWQQMNFPITNTRYLILKVKRCVDDDNRIGIAECLIK